ncbi:activity-regulated cytoskeleton-associated protein-like [Dermacentor albipictus]|uniref:activity-regulated cytoskeleton-associated protein-like n=1 Tax=Dermacentor albipictus TaxID=60249 RepID=UPI0031FD3316
MATTATQYLLQNLRGPKVFHGDIIEDVEEWLAQFDCIAEINQWSDSAKLRNVYFRLEDGTRTWYENREGLIKSWLEFRHALLETRSNADCRERAERALQFRIHLPNESVTSYVEDKTRLFRRVDPTMSEEKKLRHLMRGVKQLFAGLVRSPPKTVAEFLTKATTMDKMLHQRNCLS